jgi:hypothetical protein
LHTPRIKARGAREGKHAAWACGIDDIDAAPRSRRPSEFDEDDQPHRPRGQGEFRRSGWRGLSPLKAFFAGLLASGVLIGLGLVALM